jgi:hypothetical protein
MKRTKLNRLRKSSLVVCVTNAGYEASLERRRIYRVVPDRDAASEGRLRVVDESGEDYLYPARMFQAITLPTAVRRALRLSATG